MVEMANIETAKTINGHTQGACACFSPKSPGLWLLHSDPHGLAFVLEISKYFSGWKEPLMNFPFLTA